MKRKALPIPSLPGSVVAERVLQRRGGTNVTVTIFAPVKVTETASVEPEFWQCRYQVSGMEEDIGGFRLGTDAFAALELAIGGVRHVLKPYLQDLSWRGRDWGDTFLPFIPDCSNPRFVALMEAIAEVEHLRLAWSEPWSVRRELTTKTSASSKRPKGTTPKSRGPKASGRPARRTK